MKGKQRCDYRFDYDPKTLDPQGPQCSGFATQVIVWKGGRRSYSCPAHGPDSLSPEAKVQIAEVRSLCDECNVMTDKRGVCPSCQHVNSYIPPERLN